MAAIAAFAAMLMLTSPQLAAALTQQEMMKLCAEEWNSLKAAKQTEGKVYQDFVRDCLAQHQAAAAKEPAKPPAKVNLNTASIKELDRLPQVGADRAQAIIAARSKARFKDWNDFVSRKVIPVSAVAAIKDLVDF
ncbi:MAG: ComEA family DNA-binding protein [Xanthobacteraceae bacterium]